VECCESLTKGLVLYSKNNRKPLLDDVIAMSYNSGY
jgi:hypothetical protein